MLLLTKLSRDTAEPEKVLGLSYIRLIDKNKMYQIQIKPFSLFIHSINKFQSITLM